MWWVRSDCCGVVCALITILLMFYACFVQIYFVVGPWKGYFSLQTLLYTLLVIFGALCHTKCQFTNPGTVSLTINLSVSDPKKYSLVLHQKQTDPTKKNCRRCLQLNPNYLKPSDAHHCRDCKRCVLRMDHHCPWVNNCVGMCNQKYFLLFLLYTGCQCLFCLVSIISRFFICNSIDFHTKYKYKFDGINPNCDPTQLDIILCILNVIEGILFGLFTFIMLYDQIDAIFKNTPYIDALKGKRGKKKTRYQCLKDVFGEKFNIRWFLPSPLTSKMIENWENMSVYFGE